MCQSPLPRADVIGGFDGDTEVAVRDVTRDRLRRIGQALLLSAASSRSENKPINQRTGNSQV
jgi:hypothetical protein